MNIQIDRLRVDDYRAAKEREVREITARRPADMHANPRGLPGHGGRAERADLYWSAAGRLNPGRDGPAGAAVMTVRSVSRCRAGLAWWRTATAHSRHRSPSHSATSRGLRAVTRGGSGRLGAALVPDDGDRLPLGEPGAGRERLIEPAAA